MATASLAYPLTASAAMAITTGFSATTSPLVQHHPFANISNTLPAILQPSRVYFPLSRVFLTASRNILTVTQKSLNVTLKNMTVTLKKLNVTQKKLTVTLKKLTVTQIKLNVTQIKLTVAQVFLHLFPFLVQINNSKFKISTI